MSVGHWNHSPSCTYRYIKGPGGKIMNYLCERYCRNVKLVQSRFFLISKDAGRQDVSFCYCFKHSVYAWSIYIKSRCNNRNINNHVFF